MNSFLSNYLSAYSRAIYSLPLEKISALIVLIGEKWQDGNEIFVCGNGGSAATASHFATDLGKGASDKLTKPFRIRSLSDNNSWVTAVGNDYSFDNVFESQLRNFVRKGDMLIVISVSGNSPNIVKSITWAKNHGISTVALVDNEASFAAREADLVICTRAGHYGRAEDMHMVICHMVSFYFIENAARVDQMLGKSPMDNDLMHHLKKKID